MCRCACVDFVLNDTLDVLYSDTSLAQTAAVLASPEVVPATQPAQLGFALTCLAFSTCRLQSGLGAPLPVSSRTRKMVLQGSPFL